MARTYTILKRVWPVGKKTWVPLLVTELIFLIPLLVLFGIAQPDMYRTQFRRIGYREGLNSNPNLVIFAMVNAQPLPPVPFVWSRMLTDYNVALSIVNLFVLMVRMIAIIMKVAYPVVVLLVNAVLVAIWTVSVYGQAGPDYLDPERPSPVPWYLSKGCSIAEPYNATKNCRLAQATFAITICMLCVMIAHFAISIWAMIPRKNADVDEDDEDVDDLQETKSVTVEMSNFRNVPRTPQSTNFTPFTPRTQAFHTLDRKLPLRANYG